MDGLRDKLGLRRCLMAIKKRKKEENLAQKIGRSLLKGIFTFVLTKHYIIRLKFIIFYWHLSGDTTSMLCLIIVKELRR